MTVGKAAYLIPKGGAKFRFGFGKRRNSFSHASSKVEKWL
jgi:hypothetical protein